MLLKIKMIGLSIWQFWRKTQRKRKGKKENQQVPYFARAKNGF